MNSVQVIKVANGYIVNTDAQGSNEQPDYTKMMVTAAKAAAEQMKKDPILADLQEEQLQYEEVSPIYIFVTWKEVVAFLSFHFDK